MTTDSIAAYSPPGVSEQRGSWVLRGEEGAATVWANDLLLCAHFPDPEGRECGFVGACTFELGPCAGFYPANAAEAFELLAPFYRERILEREVRPSSE